MQSRSHVSKALWGAFLVLAFPAVTAVGQQQPPPEDEGPALNGALVMPGSAVSTGPIALPSQPAPFKWPDRPDRRELEQIPQAEQEKLAVEFMRAFAPLRLQQMEHEKGRAPAEYYQGLREALRERLEMQHLRIRAPEAFKQREKRLQTEAQCQQLATIYRNATADKRPAIEKQLRQLVNRSYDMRQAEMEQHLRNIEREYNRMKTIIEKRRKYKKQVIEIHLLRMLGEQEVLEMW